MSWEFTLHIGESPKLSRFFFPLEMSLSLSVWKVLRILLLHVWQVDFVLSLLKRLLEY